MYKIFIISILVIFFGFSQDLKTSLTFADSSFKKADFRHALDTYQRVVFFDSTEMYFSQIAHKMADCSFELKDYESAANQYDKAYVLAQSQSEKNEILLKKAHCFLATKDYLNVQIELLNTVDSVLNTEQQFSKHLLMGIAFFGTGNSDSTDATFMLAKSHFKACLADSSHYKELDDLFVKNQKISKISSKKARILSTILPGLGQFYVGDVKNGLNSLVLIGGLVYLGVRISIRNTPLDGILSVLPWIQRYYVGGYTRSAALAENAILRKRSKIYKEVLVLLEK